MELVFSDCDYGKDFESVEDLPESWKPHDPDESAFIVFKAYDASLEESDDDKKAFAEGCLFRCEIWVEWWPLGKRDYFVKFSAKNEEEAKRLLQIAADAFYNEEGC